MGTQDTTNLNIWTRKGLKMVWFVYGLKRRLQVVAEQGKKIEPIKRPLWAKGISGVLKWFKQGLIPNS